MARIRSIKPEFWSDPVMAQLSHSARLLYIGLWGYCDDEGRGQYIPKAIEGFVFPREDIMSESGGIHELLSELVDAGRIVVYEAEGEEFFHIPTWSEHQKPQHPRPSKFPAPDQGVSVSHEIVMTDSGESHEDVTPVEGEVEVEGEGVVVAPKGATIEALKAVLVEIFGEPPPKQWSLYNRIATWIRDQGGTPDEVRWKAQRIAEEWGVKALTATSLEKYWNRYTAQVGQITDADVDGYQAQVRQLSREREAQQLDSRRQLR